MKIAYVRVSTQEQNAARQEALMAKLGVDEVHIDRMSGKDARRSELQKLMEYVRRGDTVIVESISPLCPQHPQSFSVSGAAHRQGRRVRLQERGH